MLSLRLELDIVQSILEYKNKQEFFYLNVYVMGRGDEDVYYV